MTRPPPPAADEHSSAILCLDGGDVVAEPHRHPPETTKFMCHENPWRETHLLLRVVRALRRIDSRNPYSFAARHRFPDSPTCPIRKTVSHHDVVSLFVSIHFVQQTREPSGTRPNSAVIGAKAFIHSIPELLDKSQPVLPPTSVVFSQ